MIRGEGRIRSLLNLRAGLACAVCIAGCGADERALTSTVEYAPPLDHRVVVETLVDLPFDVAWDELIRRLAEGSFRISTLEKASRFVSVELERSSDLAASANLPSRYVDCGRTTRTFEGGEQTERLEYAVASSSQHREATRTETGFRVSEVNRRVELEAQANLYLVPEGERRTRISLSAQYTLSIEISGRAEELPLDADEAGGPSIAFGPRVESIRFTTAQPGKDRRGGGLTCRATGDLEHALIALANPAAAI